MRLLTLVMIVSILCAQVGRQDGIGGSCLFAANEKIKKTISDHNITTHKRGSFMSSIKFNELTKEIEIEGSESFIKSNFNRIQDLMAESFGVKKMIVANKAKTTGEPISLVIMKESQAGPETIRDEASETSPKSPATKSAIPEISDEFKAKRPPLRKYIRKEGMPGHQRTVVEVVEQKPSGISLASLKEKFGLPGSKIEGIIRDAEKLGKIRKTMNGSYVWAQD
jgi:hypothetical protein